MRWAKIFLVLLLVTSGCTETTQVWELVTYGNLEEGENPVVFNGSVSLQGKAGDVTVSGVEVYFLDEDGKVMKSVFIGRLGAGSNGYRDSVGFSSQFDQPPEYVLPSVDTIDQPDQAESDLRGLRRGQDGYSPYYDFNHNGDIPKPN